MFTALLNSELRDRFSKIDGYGTVFTVPRSAEDYRKLHELPDGLKDTVIDAFARSFGVSRALHARGKMLTYAIGLLARWSGTTCICIHREAA